MTHHDHTNDSIHTPITTYEMHYGLDHQGEPIVIEEWTNHQDTTEVVPMVTRTGLLTMAQQTLTAEAFNIFDNDNEQADEDNYEH